MVISAFDERGGDQQMTAEMTRDYKNVTEPDVETPAFAWTGHVCYREP